MDEWKKMRFEEVFKIPLKNGLTKPSRIRGSGVRMVNMKEIFAYNFITDSTPMESVPITDSEMSFNLLYDDLLFARQSLVESGAGKIAIYKGNSEAVFESHLIRCRIDKTKALPEFVYYLFKSPNGIKTVSTIVEQVAAAGIRGSDLKNLCFSFPNISEQIEIVTILKCLDEKIDLLQRQNKTLEQLAQTLFRQWFVEEANESWEVAKLGDVSVVQNGYAFSSKDYVPFQEGLLEVLKMGHIEKGGGLRTNPKKDFVPREEKLKRWILDKNDIVMAMTDMKDNVVILGVPAMIDRSNKYVLNQRVARIYLPSNKKITNSYLLYIQLNNKEFIAKLQSKANSGVQVNLSTEAIKDCDIIIPPIELQMGKGARIEELYLKKENNEKQIKILTQLRDTLLPKLMSGELRLKN